mmetsp:Transcript_49446/g.56756  ORF Transcript_49446/g.56756 Transcript_49446/m.56756 type:complete len:156 (+) Transcript_49446:34-501(+)
MFDDRSEVFAENDTVFNLYMTDYRKSLEFSFAKYILLTKAAHSFVDLTPYKKRTYVCKERCFKEFEAERNYGNIKNCLHVCEEPLNEVDKKTKDIYDHEKLSLDGKFVKCKAGADGLEISSSHHLCLWTAYNRRYRRFTGYYKEKRDDMAKRLFD